MEVVLRCKNDVRVGSTNITNSETRDDNNNRARTPPPPFFYFSILADFHSSITVMIRFSALLPISAPFQISAPLGMSFC